MVEYSKDLGACMILDDPEGDDRYMVDDRVIYSYGRVFLNWISKHKKKYLHAKCSPFLFMGLYHAPMEGSPMDLTIILLSIYGKNYVYEIIDHLTQYFHSLTILI